MQPPTDTNIIPPCWTIMSLITLFTWTLPGTSAEELAVDFVWLLHCVLCKKTEEGGQPSVNILGAFMRPQRTLSLQKPCGNDTEGSPVLLWLFESPWRSHRQALTADSFWDEAWRRVIIKYKAGHYAYTNGGHGCCFQVCELTSTHKSLPVQIIDAQFNTFQQLCQFFSCKSTNKRPFNYIVHTFLCGYFEFRAPWKKGFITVVVTHSVCTCCKYFMSGLRRKLPPSTASLYTFWHFLLSCCSVWVHWRVFYFTNHCGLDYYCLISFFAFIMCFHSYVLHPHFGICALLCVTVRLSCCLPGLVWLSWPNSGD